MLNILIVLSCFISELPPVPSTEEAWKESKTIALAKCVYSFDKETTCSLTSIGIVGFQAESVFKGTIGGFGSYGLGRSPVFYAITSNYSESSTPEYKPHKKYLLFLGSNDAFENMFFLSSRLPFCAYGEATMQAIKEINDLRLRHSKAETVRKIP